MALSPAASLKRGRGADSPETASHWSLKATTPPAQLFGTVHDGKKKLNAENGKW